MYTTIVMNIQFDRIYSVIFNKLCFDTTKVGKNNLCCTTSHCRISKFEEFQNWGSKKSINRGVLINSKLLTRLSGDEIVKVSTIKIKNIAAGDVFCTLY